MPELLSPAGNFEKLKAAALYGADAVYFAGEMFGMRAAADNFTLDEIRPTYKFDVTCQGSVPQAIGCFLEAKDFEDTARNAVSLGGDGDTISAIACSIAEANYGIPSALEERIFDYFDSTVSDYYFTGSEAIYG